MKDNSDTKVNKLSKAVAAVLILILPVFLSSIYLMDTATENRDEESYTARQANVSELVTDINNARNDAKDMFDEELRKHISIMTVSLKELVTEEGYTGPYLFEDGFVAELDGNKVVLPSGAPSADMGITAELIAESLASDPIRAGHFLMKTEVDSYDDYMDNSYYLSFGKINDDLIYVDMTSEREYVEYQDLYLSDYYDGLEATSALYDSVILVVWMNEGKSEILRGYGITDQNRDLFTAQTVEELIREQRETYETEDVSYRCAYSSQENIGTSGENMYVIQMIPYHSSMADAFLGSAVVAGVMLLINITMIVFVHSLKNYVKDNVLPPAQAEKYKPSGVRSRLISAGLFGLLVVFLTVYFTQGFVHLKYEFTYGEKAIDSLSEHYEREIEIQNNEVRMERAEWNVYRGQFIADLLSDYPELATQQMLRKYRDIINADFIMLFDGSGSEMLSSNDYVNFSLDVGLGEDSSDFRRLLYGVPSIIHMPSADSVTGETRQMVGIRTEVNDDYGKYGALIISMYPEEMRQASAYADLSEALSILNKENRLCFVADEETGKILYSGDEEMIGKTVVEYGLSENSLQSGYMDLTSVRGEHLFVLTERNDNRVFYFTSPLKLMYNNDYLFSFGIVVLYAISYIILLYWMGKGYDEAAYNKMVKAYREDERIPQRIRQKLNREEGEGTLSQYFEQFLPAEDTPEKKAGLVFNIGILILILFIIVLQQNSKLTSDSSSLILFFLKGSWVKGFNVIAFCSIVTLGGIIYVIDFLSSRILQWISSIVSGKLETICNLLQSLIRYLSVFMGLYLTLNFLGFPVETIVTSLGLVTLSLSLGAKDLAADIIAGLFLLFEKSFLVGDIVEINGKRATVIEVGLRSTKLMLPYNNIQTISNHNINTVVNLSARSSSCLISLRVSTFVPLEKVESVLERALPEISERSDMILGQANYFGVADAGGKWWYTINVTAPCNEKDMSAVRKYMNRELRLLFEKEDIALK